MIKSALVVVGLEPPTFIYNEANELWKSNSISSESCGNHTS